VLGAEDSTLREEVSRLVTPSRPPRMQQERPLLPLVARAIVPN
jgi:hypothetical protein